MSKNFQPCVKCGRSPLTDPSTSTFRFPKPGNCNYLRCELWAKYCFPDVWSSSQEFQLKLFEEHRVLCDKHFKKTSFISYPHGTIKLIKDAVPDAEVHNSLDEPSLRNINNTSIDEKVLDPNYVTIKQEKDENDFYPHLVKIKEEPDDTDNSNYMNNENLGIKLENIKCEIKEEVFASSSTNDCQHVTSISTDLQEQGIESSSNYVITDEQKTSNPKRTYNCDVCNKTFHQRVDLVTHKIIHTGVQPYGCEDCNKRFPVISDLNTHRRIHIRALSCNVCDKIFATNTRLKTHKLIHTGERPFSCDICNKKFNKNWNLKAHMKTHTREKSYSCDICDKKFCQNKSLKIHKRLHTGEKPYTCDICDKKYNQSCNLMVHKRSHTGEKPYTCDICDKKFGRSFSLKIHKRVHNDEKP